MTCRRPVLPGIRLADHWTCNCWNTGQEFGRLKIGISSCNNATVKSSAHKVDYGRLRLSEFHCPSKCSLLTMQGETSLPTLVTTTWRQSCKKLHFFPENCAENAVAEPHLTYCVKGNQVPWTFAKRKPVSEHRSSYNISDRPYSAFRVHFTEDLARLTDEL